ncbi:alpha/beta hydrolase family protein [Aquincola tertiaricarbonis]|uniref:alpha/beta hydrolase family protein n=1 Tax=Aquincola tertiaricarbonis TaxID=391953 RepID=UPI000614D5D8|nr:hypothetical protein [Aquincola tertiaricarbonis]
MTTHPKDPARWRQCLQGRAGVFSYTGDPRFAYSLYVPPHDRQQPPPGLLVTVHHSLRNFIECRDLFSDFAQRHRLVVLAPLFPINVLGDGEADGYKYLVEGPLRYDLLLDGMVQAVAADTGCDGSRFLLQGYSGGGQFAQRYFLLHPQRLRAVAIGAPGQVTLLDDQADWWAGVRDIGERFGRPLDLAALRRVPVQLVVGSEDTRTDEIGPAPPSRYWRSEEERRQSHRGDRLRKLQQSYADAGITAELEVMPGVPHGHGTTPAIALAQRFFERCLSVDG